MREPCRNCGGPKPPGRGVVFCSDECRLIARRRTHRIHNAKRRGKLREYKLRVGCQRCGYREHAAALDLHHVDKSTKVFQVSARQAAIETLDAELRKCVVICANCHRAHPDWTL